MSYDLVYLSPTQIKTMLNCERQYEFSYVEGIKRIPPGIMILGSTYHDGTEYILRGKMEGAEVSEEEALDVFNDSWNNNLEREEEGIDWSEDTPSTLKDAGVDLIKMYNSSMLPNMNPVMVEAGFLIQTDTVPLKGFIDLVREEKGELVLNDHKIARRRSDQSKHFVQLTLYTVGMKEDYDMDISRTEVQLAVAGKKNRDITIEPLERTTDADKRFVMELVNTTAKKIQAGLFAPTGVGTWACSEKWCGYWDMCRGRRA
jgi:hypothetical protein